MGGPTPAGRDLAYQGAGSAEWMNWARAILTIKKTGAGNVFELNAGKRGGRLSWKEADGLTTSYKRFIAHCKEPGTICWIDVDPELAEGLGNGNCINADDVFKHIPDCSPIKKNTLIETCGRNGLGENKARNLIRVLLREDKVYELHKNGLHSLQGV